LPLDDGSVDAVLVAQAWHWVHPGRASREVARVLVPGGRLGLVWNLRDPGTAWVTELERIVAEPGLGHGRDDLPPPEVGPPFGPLESTRVPWSTRLTPDAVVDLVASRSWAITMPWRRREAMFADIRQLLATHPDTAGRDLVDLPYIARCYRTGSASGVTPRSAASHGYGIGDRRRAACTTWISSWAWPGAEAAGPRFTCAIRPGSTLGARSSVSSPLRSCAVSVSWV
jgi:SAM-dependent methyltransferase